MVRVHSSIRNRSNTDRSIRNRNHHNTDRIRNRSMRRSPVHRRRRPIHTRGPCRSNRRSPPRARNAPRSRRPVRNPRLGRSSARHNKEHRTARDHNERARKEHTRTVHSSRNFGCRRACRGRRGYGQTPGIRNSRCSRRRPREPSWPAKRVSWYFPTFHA